MKKIIPYPLRAARLSLDLHPFGFWMPKFRKTGTTEEGKQQGNVIWYARFAWFQVSFRRWV